MIYGRFFSYLAYPCFHRCWNLNLQTFMPIIFIDTCAQNIKMPIYKILSKTSPNNHYSDVIISVVASQITSVSSVCSAVCSSVDQRKHQSSASLALVRGIYRWRVDSPHKEPVTRKIFPFDDVIMSRRSSDFGPCHLWPFPPNHFDMDTWP